MDRFDCQSRLSISVSHIRGKQMVTVALQHTKRHVPYCSVDMPPEALQIIREHLWSIPSALVEQIQPNFPQVSAQQIHSAWAEMSEVLWKRKDNQVESASELLKEMGDNVEILQIETVEGVSALAWGLRKTVTRLQGKIMEVALDATCESLRETYKSPPLTYNSQITRIRKISNYMRSWASTITQASL